MVRSVLRILTTTALVAAPLASASAQQLVLASPDPVSFSGTGLGAVNTILTLQGQGNSTIEMGCVGTTGGADFLGPTGSGPCVAGPETDVNNGQSQTQLLSALGITSSSQFGILFNASEPAGNGITLQNLTATFYTPTGTTSSFSLASAFTTTTTLTGTGNSGFLFTLSGAPFTFAAGTRVGLSATAGCATATETSTCLAATGGQETFSLVNTGNVGGGPGGSVVPEPSTYMLLGTGLLGLAGLARRRRQS